MSYARRVTVNAVCFARGASTPTGGKFGWKGFLFLIFLNHKKSKLSGLRDEKKSDESESIDSLEIFTEHNPIQPLQTSWIGRIYCPLLSYRTG